MQAKSDLLVDSDEKENLLAAAAELSDATTELLAAAKVDQINFCVLNKLFVRCLLSSYSLVRSSFKIIYIKYLYLPVFPASEGQSKEQI